MQLARSILRNSTLGLLLFSATLTLRSYRLRDVIYVDRASGPAEQLTRWYVATDRGGVVAGAEVRPHESSGERPSLSGSLAWRTADCGSGPRRALGDGFVGRAIGIGHRDFSVPNHRIGYREVYFPIFLPLIVLSAPFAAWCIRRWLRRQRQKSGHCRQCGYDLRSSPEVCPECGSRKTPLVSPRRPAARLAAIAVIVAAMVWFLFTDALGSREQSAVSKSHIAAVHPATTRAAPGNAAPPRANASFELSRVFLISTRTRVSKRDDVRAELQVFVRSDEVWTVRSIIVSPGGQIAARGTDGAFDTGMTLLSLNRAGTSAIAVIAARDGKCTEHDLLADIASQERKGLLAIARPP